MKNGVGLTAGLLLVLAACNSGTDIDANAIMADSGNYTSIKWLDSIKSFDTITMGEQVKLGFRFRNTGDKPLYLTNVKAACGCTVPDYTR
ncbi:MAG: DUF1573 domain-containing protein, partial [Chitinophagaceae bacterium]|nr:DUF1573 domain-containing protein [Chitinophagaceae bacterium]